MSENQNGFHIYDDDDNDIGSYKNNGEYEDIVSDTAFKSSAKTDDYIDFISYSDGKHFGKQKHGFWAIPDMVTGWWNERKKWQKGLLAAGLTVFTLLCIFIIWNFIPLGIRGKLFGTLLGLLCLTLLVYFFIRWEKRGIQTAVTSVISVVLSLAMIFTLFFLIPLIQKQYNYDGDFDSDKVVAVPKLDKDITNIALFGIDSRSEEKFSGNSDSIMILSLNAKTHSVKIISIMRDSLVPIEQKGKKTPYKINAAYSWGGAELAVKTLNQNFGLDITDYATIDFYGMAQMIDAVGGIDVELTEREVKARGNNNHGINDMIEEVCLLKGLKPKDYYVTKSGSQHLNGIQAVAYSRIRYVPNIWGSNNDFGRTERQRYVMEQLFKKAVVLNSSQYLPLINSLIKYTQTSLNPDEILGFALNILTKSPTFSQNRIPMDKTQMTSPSGSFGSVVYYDLDYAADLIHAFIYDDITFEDYAAANGIEKNDWYREKGYGGSYSNSGSGSGNSGTKPNNPTTEEPKDDTPSDTPSDTSSDDTSSDTPSDTEPNPDDEEKDPADDTTTSPDDEEAETNPTTPPVTDTPPTEET